jgi:hypothetical protein
MVRGRYMSLLTSFADDELAAGLQEMEARYRGDDYLDFTDRFDFIVASKA